MAPLADVQLTCVSWLEHYFEAYGEDHSPNSLHTKVNITFKKDVHHEYKGQVSGCNEGYKVVGYPRFCELWCVLSLIVSIDLGAMFLASANSVMK